MEYEVVKKWLDELVNDFLAATRSRELGLNIRAKACTDMSICVYEGLDIVADVMGFKMSEREIIIDGEKWYAYEIEYRKVKFCEYRRKRYNGYGDAE